MHTLSLFATQIFDPTFFKTTVVLQNLVNALSNGAVYALMGLTVVIIYKTTGHLNFAQAEMAMFSTFIVFVLAHEQHWPIFLALLVATLISMAFGALLERTLVRPLAHRSALAPVIVTLGVFFILNATAAVIWRTDPRSPLPKIFPGKLSDRFVVMNGPPKFIIKYKALGTWGLVIALVIVLFFLLQRTKLGLAYRAVASNSESSELVGIPVGRMLMFGWALAAGLGSIAGAVVVQADGGSLNFNFMAPYLLFGFVAACVGGFDSIPGAVVGGVLVGMVQTFIPAVFKIIGTEFNFVVALAVIMIVLVFRPQGLFGSKRVERV